MTVTLASTQRERLSRETILPAFVVLAAVYVIASRLIVAETAPLWLDETWSAMIATRPNWAEFWYEAWLDCNPPLYYLLLLGWVNIFGDSNLMLRLPSFIFVFLAAILPIVWRPKALNQTAAWTWAGLILLWPSGSLMMLDARSYALMLLLSTASCLTFVRLLDHLSNRLATGWIVLGTMMFMTHYFSAVLLAAQSVILVWRYRSTLFRLWAATIIAVPGIIWFVIHLPRLEEYARKDVAWQELTTVGSSIVHLFYVVGAMNFVLLGLILLVVSYAGIPRKEMPEKGTVTETPADRTLWLTASTAAIAFGLALCIGMFQASLIDRYLVPLVPPTLLGLVLIIQRGVRQEIGGILLLLTFLLPILPPKAIENMAEMRGIYGYERESDFVSSYEPDQVIFVWDHPAAKILDPASLERIGGYFQQRAGFNIPIRALVVPEYTDANTLLRDAAKGKRTGIIWLYNSADRTAARSYPPEFENSPDWNCRSRGVEAGRTRPLGAIACVNMERVVD